MKQRDGSLSPEANKGAFSSDPAGLDVSAASLATTSTTRTETLEHLRHASTALKKYMMAEVDTHTEEWLFLERCNALLYDRCKDMRSSTMEAVQELESTARALERLSPQLSRIDAVESQLVALEETVNLIDEYSKALADRLGCE